MHSWLCLCTELITCTCWEHLCVPHSPAAVCSYVERVAGVWCCRADHLLLQGMVEELGIAVMVYTSTASGVDAMPVWPTTVDDWTAANLTPYVIAYGELMRVCMRNLGDQRQAQQSVLQLPAASLWWACTTRLFSFIWFGYIDPGGWMMFLHCCNCCGSASSNLGFQHVLVVGNVFQYICIK